MASELSDLIEERAAIIEEGEGVTRAFAQDIAARLYGFAGWAEYRSKTSTKQKMET